MDQLAVSSGGIDTITTSLPCGFEAALELERGKVVRFLVGLDKVLVIRRGLLGLSRRVV